MPHAGGCDAVKLTGMTMCRVDVFERRKLQEGCSVFLPTWKRLAAILVDAVFHPLGQFAKVVESQPGVTDTLSVTLPILTWFCRGRQFTNSDWREERRIEKYIIDSREFSTDMPNEERETTVGK
jgi:hypothetical protein